MNSISRAQVSKLFSSMGIMGILLLYCFAGGLPSVYAGAEAIPAQAAPPVNDDFDNAIAFIVPYTDTRNISEATKAADDPLLTCSTGFGGKTVWYKYTPSSSGLLTLDTIGSNYDTILAAWTGTRGSLVNVGCKDDGAGLQSLLWVHVSAGTTYYVEVASYNSPPEGTSLTINASQMDDFGKTSPANGALDRPTSLTLSWAASNGATSYEYCYDTTNDSQCDAWTSAGGSTSAAISGLNVDTTYYWQVRARKGTSLLEADYSEAAQAGVWWSFTTVPPPPGPFGKSSPANGLSNVSTSPTLSWASSSRATGYQYCYDTSNNNECNSVWTSAGASTSIGLSGLSPSTTYYWQVRATNAGGTTYANGGTWWSFSTHPPAPGAFGKSAPSNGAGNVSTSPTLSWASSSGAAGYEYCYDTVNNSACDGSWVSNGASTSIGLAGLNTNTTYYWQVRATNAGGTTYANGGTWWSFSTLPPLPGAFGKSAPSNGAGNVSASPTLSWSASSSAAGYEYCYDTINNNACDGNWVSTATGTSVRLYGLAVNTHYWQVRAVNAAGTTNANGGTWWSFTTVPTFADVAGDFWAFSWIERLYAAGITGGCKITPLEYCPENKVTRAQMAVFLERGMNGSAYNPPPATGAAFGDVPADYWAAGWIEQLASDGITAGCGGGNYCPEEKVTRDQMAVFLLRARYGSGFNPPPATGTVFADVPASYWAAAWIEKLAADQITTGCGLGNYCPLNEVTRAEMAVFLVKTFSFP